MKNLKNIRLFLVLASVLASPILSAAPILDQSQNDITTITGVGYFPGDGINYKAAQNIAPTLDFLTSVEFQRSDATLAQVTLSIWGAVSTSASTPPESGALLGTKTITVSSSGLFIFDFSDVPIDVSSYKSGVGIVSLVLTADTYINPYIASGNVYPAGSFFVQNTLAQTWTPVSADLYFNQYGIAAIPEPRGLLLCGLALGVILVIGRVKRTSHGI